MSEQTEKSHISLISAIAVGVGAMIGAGIFSIIGVVAGVSGSALPLVFILGAAITIFSVYSYSKLGVRFPSIGGPVEFLVRGFGDNILSGGLNIFQYIAYVISLALYASGFAEYAVAFFSNSPQWWTKAFAIGIVIAFVIINFISASLMGKSETYIVAVKLTILIVFAVIGLFFIQAARLSPANWKPPIDTVFAAAIAFIGFQGFGLVTNTAGDMKNPTRDLPRALYLSFIITTAVYVLVAATVIGTTSMSTITSTSGDVLSVVAQGFLGKFGFYALAVAALLSTASAVNATLFGAANIAYQVAKDGELPREMFMKELWHKNVEGLFLTAALVIALLLVFDLAPISMMASGGFLIVYAAVNASHMRISKTTGARLWMIGVATILTSIMFFVLLFYMIRSAPSIAWITLVTLFIVSFMLEWIYRRLTGRSFKSILDRPASPRRAA